MNKTININIGGYAFIIDETAYAQLEGYLNQIRNIYRHSQGCDEIMQGIEERIAELLKEYLGGREVVALADVNKVIDVMGRVEDYETDEEQPRNSFQSRTTGKRLFRDGDEKIVGGVASGLGHFFGVSSVWMRLAFLFIFFFFGTGILVYLILWLIMPEAKSQAEKLEMKGDPVNFGNLGKSIETEFNRVSDSLSGGTNLGTKLGQVLKDIAGFVIETLRLIIKVVVKLVAMIFMMIGILGFAALFAIIVGLPNAINLSMDGYNSSFGIYELTGFLAGDVVLTAISAFGVLLVVGVPLVVLVWFGLMIITPRTYGSRWIGWSAFFIWIFGLLLLVVSSALIATDYQVSRTIVATEEIQINAGDTLELALGNDPFSIAPENRYEANQLPYFLFNKDVDNEIYVGAVEVNVKRTNGANYMNIVKFSRNGSIEKAAQSAKSIQASFNLDSNLVEVDSYFSIPKAERFGVKRLRYDIYLSDSTYLYIHDGAERIITDIRNQQNIYDPEMTGNYYRMEPNGLNCTSWVTFD